MTKSFVAFIVCITILGLGLMMFFPVPVRGKMDQQPALTTHTDYTVQGIDGCEYILYRIHNRTGYSYECRMIHSGSCKNHRD